jgi:hypothetical protein
VEKRKKRLDKVNKVLKWKTKHSRTFGEIKIANTFQVYFLNESL